MEKDGALVHYPFRLYAERSERGDPDARFAEQYARFGLADCARRPRARQPHVPNARWAAWLESSLHTSVDQFLEGVSLWLRRRFVCLIFRARKLLRERAPLFVLRSLTHEKVRVNLT
jgi:hypothetical protein